MKKKFFTAALAVSTISGVLIGQVSPAKALAIDTCVGNNYDISAKVNPNIGCRISDTFSNDPQGFNNVNDDKFFEYNDWIFGGKLEGGQVSTPVGDLLVTGLGNGQSGVWNVGNFAAQSDVMAIFKSGQGTKLVGYLLDSATASWQTPFTKPPFTFNGNNSKDTSHVSFYYRDAEAVVPTPAAVLPALFGMGAAAIRKKRSATEDIHEA